MTYQANAFNRESPLVSVIIPCFNAEHYIVECVQSCLSQTYSKLEVIIVDDGSDPSTKNLLRDIVEHDITGRVRVVTHQGGVNKGVLASRLLGFKHANGHLISLLDADDKYNPTRIERQIECLYRFPTVVLCHTGIEILGDTTNASNHEFHFSSSPARPYKLQDLPDFLNRLHICNSSVLFRADAFRGLRVPSYMLYQLEDWVLWVLLSRRGFFVQLPEPLTFYRIHDASFSFQNSNNLLQKQFSRIEFLLVIALYTFPSYCSFRSSMLLFRASAGALAMYYRMKTIVRFGLG